jgi:hypothetical protein
MGRTTCTAPQCLYSRAIPLLPLWAARPVQNISACTRVHCNACRAVDGVRWDACWCDGLRLAQGVERGGCGFWRDTIVSLDWKNWGQPRKPDWSLLVSVVIRALELRSKKTRVRHWAASLGWLFECRVAAQHLDHVGTKVQRRVPYMLLGQTDSVFTFIVHIRTVAHGPHCCFGYILRLTKGAETLRSQQLLSSEIPRILWNAFIHYRVYKCPVFALP